MILKGYIFGFLYALICLSVALLAYRLGFPKKYSRKLVHILVGFEWVILYIYMGASYHFLIVCIAFLVLLSVSYIKNLMPMISSESDNAPGTVYYALAMTVMAVICLFIPDMMLPFGISVFVTSFGDGGAGLVGQLLKKHNPKIFKNKTLFGSISNFVLSVITVIIFDRIFDMGFKVWHYVAIGIFAVVLELVTGHGFDNIILTLGSAFLSFAFLYIPEVEFFVIPIILTPFVAAFAIEKKVLTRFGVLLAVILDVIVTIAFGNLGFVLLSVFLFGSVVIDKIKEKKKSLDILEKKSSCRDSVQVIANGLAPLIMAMMYSITIDKIFMVGYVAALAEALADTSASGMGVFAKYTFDPFKMKKVRSGLSGGMSVIGTVASFVGALILSFVAFLFGAVDLKLMLVAAVCAFLGAVFDSFIGSVLQIKYKCRICKEITENEIHCGKYTDRFSGLAFFDNDVVNLFSGFFAAILAVFATLLL